MGFDFPTAMEERRDPERVRPTVDNQCILFDHLGRVYEAGGSEDESEDQDSRNTDRVSSSRHRRSPTRKKQRPQSVCGDGDARYRPRRLESACSIHVHARRYIYREGVVGMRANRPRYSGSGVYGPEARRRISTALRSDGAGWEG